MQLKTGLGVFTAIVLLSSIIAINISSFAQTNSESKTDHRDKIDKPFRDKIDKMVQTGEKGYHRVIIFVKKASATDSEGHKFDASKNKDTLEVALVKDHSAKNVYKAKVLSFVSAEVPIQQIDQIAAYDYVDQIGDEELEVKPLSLVERSDEDSFLSNHPNKALPVETNLNVAKQAVNSPTVGPTGTGIKVALLDTGIRQDHNDLPVGQTIILQASCDPLPCHVVPPAEAGDDLNHGTHSAGIIAGQGTIDGNLKGVAPGAKLFNIKPASQFPEALDFALLQGARVVSINLATGDCVGPGDQYNSFIRATDEAVEMGAVIATGIGNNGGSNAVNDLSCGYNVLAVGAFNDMNTPTTTDDAVWPNSFRGPAFDNRLKPELVAPGVNINSTDKFVNYANVNGTSFAGPFVAAASVLILEQHPNFSPEQVRATLLVGARWNGTVPLSASTYEQGADPSLNSKGFGFLDIGNSLNVANSAKVVKDTIQSGQTKEYAVSANQGEQVKIVLTWNRHLIGNITDNTPRNLSNLDFKVINASNGSEVIISNSINQNNEFAIFNATVTGKYTIRVSAVTVDTQVGTETFALASTHAISTYLFKKGTFTKTTAAAPASQSIIDVGFKPKALILFTTGQSTEGFNDVYNFAMGFSSGPSNSRSIGVQSDDAAAKSNAGRAFGEKLLKLLNSGKPTISAECDLTSFDSNGFTINWTKNDSTASIIHYIALGGADLTNALVSSFPASTATGNQIVTIGFQPDFLMFMHAASTKETFTDTHGYVSYGFATSSVQRGAIAVTSEDFVDPMDTWRIQRTDRAIIALDESTGAIDAEADFVVMNTDGFTIKWIDAPANADKIYFLALKGGRYNVSNFVKTTSPAPVTQALTSSGFQPKGLILSSFNDIAATTVQPYNRLSLGVSDGTAEGTIWAGDQDNAADSITAHSGTIIKVIRLATEQVTGISSTIDSEADLQSFDDDGFTLNWTANDSVAKQILYVAFGEHSGFDSFGTLINLSNSLGDSGFQEVAFSGNNIATSGNNVYVVWHDSKLGNYEIFFRRSVDNGASFAPTINLSNSPGDSFFPQVAASGNNVYVVWPDGSTFFRRSTDSGASFGSTIDLGTSSASGLRVAASGNNVYVVWEGQIGTNHEIFFRASNDNGASFGTIINLSNNTTPSQISEMAVYGNNVYVVWQDKVFTAEASEIFFRRSTDNGASFAPTINLSNNVGFSDFPQVAASGNNVYVVWHDDTSGNREIFFKKSVDSGASFSSIINLSNNATPSELPKIDVDGNNVYVVWRDNFTPFFRASNDNGATFGSIINLSNTVGSSSIPQVAASGNNVYGLWQDSSLSNDEIFFRASNDNGATFGSIINLSNTATECSVDQQIVAVGNRVYVAWEDTACSGNPEIFFRAGQN